MRILDGVRASIAIPCFFTPWIDPVSTDIYCDGAIIEYYPWMSVKNEDKDKTLVVACSDTHIATKKKVQNLSSFVDYIGRIITILRSKSQSVRPRNWIAINNRRFDFMNFYLTRDEQSELFIEGETAAIRWIKFVTTIEETREIQQLSVDRCTLNAANRYPSKMSDNQKFHIPQQPVDQVPDLQIALRSTKRRWSL